MVRHLITSPDGVVSDSREHSWPETFGDVAAQVQNERSVWDTCRFAKTRAFPLALTFTDAANIRHKILIEQTEDRYTMIFAVKHGEVFWHGDEVDRTKLYGNVAQVTFSYQPKNLLHSHGIRLKSRSGLLSEREAANTERWLDLAGATPKVSHQGQLATVASWCRRIASRLCASGPCFPT
mmetsp:Transcript_126154/g.315338  ORF Transcript_126154/g.315338 Transcript_126154/m.315338 type:complete len:180 (-) Transcript_126154:120-659(-)